MSKLFKISGNLMQDGEWKKPDPAFAGEIVVDDDGKFRGWCDELCDNKKEEYTELDWHHYLVGAVAKENGGYSLLFFGLSNAPWRPPLLCEIHDASASDSVWAIKDPGGGFVPMGNARVTLEELKYSEDYVHQVEKCFQEVDLSINGNETWIQEVGSWYQQALVLWMWPNEENLAV